MHVWRLSLVKYLSSITLRVPSRLTECSHVRYISHHLQNCKSLIPEVLFPSFLLISVVHGMQEINSVGMSCEESKANKYLIILVVIVFSLKSQNVLGN